MQKLFLKKNHTYFDPIILTSELESQDLLETVGGVSYLITLTNVLPSATNYQITLLKSVCVMVKTRETCW